MSYHEHRKQAPESVTCAVLTVSDSRTEEDDESGKILRQKLEQNGHRVTAHFILKNEVKALRNRLERLLEMKELQVIITSGGTGAGSRDITIETVSPMLEKRLDGFGELFRFLTYQELGTASIMSRAMAGTIRGRVILCLPGSPGAANLAMDKIILPEIGHLVREATR